MNNQTQTPIEIPKKLIWAALTFSMFIYGFALAAIHPNFIFEFPSSELTLTEKGALFAPLILFATFFLRKQFTSYYTSKEFSFTLFIVSLAAHEAVCILGFMASFFSESQNIYFYAVNTLFAFIANIFFYPRD